eukprot:gnl/Dysnectes_brevis/5802_a8584_395.p1 GENE.gnl/Dysnectes_brevis/5802_a8584_395~~gnl/Dysnectes_brevis/5802_a8584_395.p1  ORF type:complete len:210 (-),score=40.59 gnl/Dysnectes_brevis/5802_a8584_395:102-731(-)
MKQQAQTTASNQQQLTTFLHHSLIHVQPDKRSSVIDQRIGTYSIQLRSMTHYDDFTEEAQKERRKKVCMNALRSQSKRRRRKPAADHDAVTWPQALLLHRMWAQYTRQVRKDGGYNQAGLTALDLHGAAITVFRASDPTMVGVKGIVIAETQSTLVIRHQQGSTRLIKGGVGIRVHLPPDLGSSLLIHGPLLMRRQRVAKRTTMELWEK